MSNKKQMIAKRENARAQLQIMNLQRLLVQLKKELINESGVGMSLPAVEEQMGRIGTSCRAYQNAAFTRDSEYECKPDDLEKSIQKIQEEIDQIEDEIGDPWPGMKKEDDYPDKEIHEKYARENPEIGQDLMSDEDIAAVNDKLLQEKNTKVF